MRDCIVLKDLCKVDNYWSDKTKSLSERPLVRRFRACSVKRALF